MILIETFPEDKLLRQIAAETTPRKLPFWSRKVTITAYAGSRLQLKYRGAAVRRLQALRLLWSDWNQDARR